MHANAPLAAEAAREAYAQKGAAGFWKMHDALLDHHGQLARTDLDGYAREQGLDIKRWATALDNRTHQREVEASSQAAANASITGTPAFVINGYFISGAESIRRFRRIIDRALEEAK